MERVTLVWVTRKGGSSRVFTLPREAVVGAAAGALLALLLCVGSVLWAGALAWRVSERARENRGLEQALARQEALLGEREAMAQELAREKERMAGELEQIRATESRIRRFLGLNEQRYEAKRSHQGGMGPAGVPGDLPAERLPEVPEEGGATAGFHDTAAMIRDGLLEVAAHLEDRRELARRVPTILPVVSDQAWLSCNFGWREDPFSGLGREFHNGIDIAGPWRSPVVAPADGDVAQVGKDRLLGTYVKLRHGGSIQTVYGHLAAAAVKSGRRVKRGEVVGYMGNTGRSTGTHLHYSVSVGGTYVDPQDYIWDRPFRTLTL